MKKVKLTKSYKLEKFLNYDDNNLGKKHYLN